MECDPEHMYGYTDGDTGVALPSENIKTEMEGSISKTRA